MGRIAVTLILLMACLFGGGILSASPGDTLRVNLFDRLNIPSTSGRRTDFKTWVNIPRVSIHKAFFIAKYECLEDGGCGHWDYLNHLFITGRGTESSVIPLPLAVEIVRSITPYGGYWRSEQKWFFDWKIDVTNFSPFLVGDIEFTHRHTHYETDPRLGWRLTLDLYLVEGPPPRAIISLTPIDSWNGSHLYGAAASPFSERVTTYVFRTHEEATHASLAIVQTGHGADSPDICAEFCSRERTILVNGKVHTKKNIWKACGNNSLQAQAGTWDSDRAGWCPGLPVDPEHHDFPVVGATDYNLDLKMEEYFNSLYIQGHESRGKHGNYVIYAYVVQYRGYSFRNEVAVSDVIAPNNLREHAYYNPICANPIVVIQNGGEYDLRSAKINYGLRGADPRSQKSYRWRGRLPFGKKDTLFLPGILDWEFARNSLEKVYFRVEVSQPNGLIDEYAGNNVIETEYTVPVAYNYQDGFKVDIRGNIQSPLHNRLVLEKIDPNGTQELLRFARFYSGSYVKNIALKPGNCYVMNLYDDGGRKWEDNYRISISNGLSSLTGRQNGVRTPGSISVNDPEYPDRVRVLPADFGTRVSYRFITLGEIQYPIVKEPRPCEKTGDCIEEPPPPAPVSVLGSDRNNGSLDYPIVYPNSSADGVFNLRGNPDSIFHKIEVFALSGEIAHVKEFGALKRVQNSLIRLELPDLFPGLYLMRIHLQGGELRLRRIIIL
ncbi:MAG: peptide-N-glycosidase F-related protein [Cytophagales bacterium]|nr:peptide-N-glycosidase F-related protein [Cytophagales bacterium]